MKRRDNSKFECECVRLNGAARAEEYIVNRNEHVQVKIGRISTTFLRKQMILFVCAVVVVAVAGGANVLMCTQAESVTFSQPG